MARPRLLSEPKKHEIVAMLACGCTFEAAARYACCSVKTIRREARRNAEFHERIRQALISSQVTPVNVLHDHASRDWRAAAWLLERTDPGRFAKRTAKTFTEAEVVDMLGRVYDIVRRQVDDKPKRLQIKRQLRTLARATLRPTTKAKLPTLQLVRPRRNSDTAQVINAKAEKLEDASTRADVAQHKPQTAERTPANARHPRAAGQNDPEPRSVLTAASDVSSSYSSTLAGCDGT